MKKTLLYIFALMAGLGLQSCLHDDDELFDVPAEQRIDQAIEADRQLLESAPNGWIMRYYAGEGYLYGGRTFLVKFHGGKADVSGEIATPDMVTSSSYGFDKDKGVVLTFNTYNEIMHYLAQPMQDPVDGLQGDFEFTVMRTTQDSVFLKGKKWGNDMLLVRAPETVNWSEYIDKVQSMDKKMFRSYSLWQGADSIGTVKLDASRHMQVTTTTDTLDVPYYVTPTGIGLQHSVTLGGRQVELLDYDSVNVSLTSATLGDLSFKLRLPDYYVPYDEFNGDFNFTTMISFFGFEFPTDHQVKLETTGDGETVLMKGLMTSHDIVLGYDKLEGALTMKMQRIGEAGGVDVWLIPLDYDAGYVTWSEDAGMIFKRDMTQKNTLFLAGEDNGYWSGNNVNGFILWKFNGVPSGTTSAGQVQSGDVPAGWMLDGSTMLTNVKSISRIDK